ncbi:MAG TPA: arginine--tRNA ligase [bacterium]|nr:arginine--tRNA ligase [bacterium]HOL47887.1 arginine--tRNA ligase [bacterium]HPQ19675.1 arginine--tRNA ligase [bacterium]
MISKIHNYFFNNLKLLYPDLNLEQIIFKTEKTKFEKFGDYAINVAMILAKHLKKSPMLIADEIIKKIELPDYIEKFEIANPGFINIFIKKNFLYKQLFEIYKQKERYGYKEKKDKERVLIEYVSANPTGPLNVVSARAAATGSTFVNIFNYCGYDCKSEFYVNDAGNQVEILARSLFLRYLQLYQSDIEFPPECYQGEYIKEFAIKFNNEYGSKYINNFDVELFKNYAVSKMLAWQQNTLKNYRVNFDNFFSEKKLRESGEVEKIYKFLQEQNLVYEKDNAFWFRSTNFFDDKDRVLIKSDGEWTYLLPDIAYHKNKYDRGFDLLINILGPDHHGYINRILSAVKAFGKSEKSLKIIILQQVNLFREGKKVKMSKRAGELINLDDLIEEVGVDAARYFFLRRSPSSHLDFDLTLAKEQSQNNPVYYVQYSCARISSILEKINLSNFNPDNIDLSILNHHLEIDLIKHLLDFEDVLSSITISLEPHHIIMYVEELAAKFHAFYTECRVIDAPDDLKFARYILIKAVHYIIKIILNLIGVSAPEKM